MNWKKWLFPPVWVMLLLTLFSAVGLVLVFTNGWDESLPGILVYIVSFYTLSVLCIYFSMVFPKRYGQIKKRLYEIPLTKRYLTDRVFRTQVSLHMSLLINLLYAAFNVLSGLLSGSMWFIIFAVYYTVLAVMRFVLVRYTRLVGIGKNVVQELKNSRLCGYILLLVNLTLSGAVLMMAYQNRGFEYPGILIYVMALYTFYSATYGIICMVRYRRYGSPVMSTAKTITLAAALVSMLSLETAMFAQFGGEMSPESQRLMIILTGAGVSLIVIAMSVYMICHANAALQIRREENGG